MPVRGGGGGGVPSPSLPSTVNITGLASVIAALVTWLEASGKGNDYISAINHEELLYSASLSFVKDRRTKISPTRSTLAACFVNQCDATSYTR